MVWLRQYVCSSSSRSKFSHDGANYRAVVSRTGLCVVLLIVQCLGALAMLLLGSVSVLAGAEQVKGGDLGCVVYSHKK